MKLSNLIQRLYQSRINRISNNGVSYCTNLYYSIMIFNKHYQPNPQSLYINSLIYNSLDSMQLEIQ